jgi:hypothetical protein
MKQPITTDSKVVVLPNSADPTHRLAPVNDVANRSPSDRATDRKLRRLVVLATAVVWIAILAAMQFIFF